MKNIKLAVLALFLSVLAAKGFASDYMGDLGTLVVTPTGSSRPASLVPSDIKIITAEEIQSANLSSSADILRAQGGVVIQDYYGNGNTARVDMLGYGDMAPQTVLVLVDGRKMDSPDMEGINWNQINPDQIERIEIIRGSGNVIYGDNSNAGIINIITRKGQKNSVSREVSYRTSSYDGLGGRVSLSGPLGPISGRVEVTGNETDGYRDNGFASGRGAIASLSFIDEKNEVNFKSGYHLEEYGMPGYLSVSDLEEGRNRTETDDPDNKVKAYDSYIHLDGLSKMADNLMLGLNYSYQQKLKTAKWPSSQNDRDNFRNTGAVKVISDFPLGGFKNRLTAGYEGEFNTLISKWPSSRDEIKVTAGAPYILEEFFLFKNFMVTAGWREQRSNYNFKSEGIDFFGNTISTSNAISRIEDAYKFGFTWLFARGGRFYAGYDKTFRFPKTDQFFSIYSSPSLNRDLTPESSRDIQSGLDYIYKDILSGGVNYRGSITSNEIYLDPNEGFFGTNKNYEEKIRRDIVSLRGELFPGGRLKLGFEQSIINAAFEEGDYEGNDVPGVPKFKTAVFLTAQPSERIFVNLDVQNIGERYLINDLNNEYEKLGPFTKLNLSLGYEQAGFTIRGRINNILNKKYSEYGAVNVTSGIQGVYPAPERNFALEISMSY